jgi:hypothetical protein
VPIKIGAISKKKKASQILVGGIKVEQNPSQPKMSEIE